MADEPRTDTTEPESAATATEQEPAGEGAAGDDKPEKLHQTVEMRDVGPCKKHIKVTVERQDIDRLLEDKFSKLVVDSHVSGFRPGKAPRKIIEKRFQKDVVEQIRGELLLASLEQLAEENDVAPLSAPDIDASKIEIPKEGPFVYEFEVEVRPEFDLPNYKGLKIRRPVREFSDEDVAEEERRLLAPYGQQVPKPEGDPQLGDYVIADVRTQAGGRVLSDLKEVKVRVERRLVFKDGVADKFFEQVKGARPGDRKTVDITLSENVADESLRGQKVQAVFDVKDVKALRSPELTHELMHEFGVHSPDQLRERIRVLLKWRLEYLQRQSAREQVLGQIAEAANWQLPQDLLARQARKALSRKVMEMRSSGMSDDEINARARLLQQDALQSTERALKEIFVLQKIAEVEKIEADEDDLQDEIERIANRTGETPRRVRARLEKEELTDALAAEIVEAKALDLVLQNAEYEDVPVGPEAEQEGSVATVEEQAVPGEIKDLTAPPPEQKPEEEKKEGDGAPEAKA